MIFLSFYLLFKGVFNFYSGIPAKKRKFIINKSLDIGYFFTYIKMNDIIFYIKSKNKVCVLCNILLAC